MILYVDAINGAAGDMLLGALCAAGADFERIRADLARLPVKGYEVALDQVYHGELRASRLTVEVHEDQPHRHLSDIHAILDPAPLPGRVKDRAKASFRRLAEAEGRVHGMDPEEVHFHEVGAVDAIVDVVGTCLALEQLGIDEVVCSSVPVGKGTVRCAHGLMPVPVPAVTELLSGVPIYDNGESGELVTPTGAALLVTLCRAFGPMPAMTLHSSGFGGGTRQGDRLPNVVRVLVGERVAHRATEPAVVLEANLDDATPQQLAFAAERLLDAGALDVTTTPTAMKKGRLGVVLSVLADPARAEALAELMLAETPSLGVRMHRVDRLVADRRFREVSTPWGTVRVKYGLNREQVTNLMPEYADCARLAKEAGVPFKEVWQQAIAAAVRDQDRSSWLASL